MKNPGSRTPGTALCDPRNPRTHTRRNSRSDYPVGDSLPINVGKTLPLLRETCHCQSPMPHHLSSWSRRKRQGQSWPKLADDFVCGSKSTRNRPVVPPSNVPVLRHPGLCNPCSAMSLSTASLFVSSHALHSAPLHAQ